MSVIISEDVSQSNSILPNPGVAKKPVEAEPDACNNILNRKSSFGISQPSQSSIASVTRIRLIPSAAPTDIS